MLVAPLARRLAFAAAAAAFAFAAAAGPAAAAAIRAEAPDLVSSGDAAVDLAASPDVCGQLGVDSVSTAGIGIRAFADAPVSASDGCAFARDRAANPNLAPAVAAYEAARADLANSAAAPPADPGSVVEADLGDVVLPELAAPATPDLPGLPGSDVALPDSAADSSGPLGRAESRAAAAAAASAASVAGDGVVSTPMDMKSRSEGGSAPPAGSGDGSPFSAYAPMTAATLAPKVLGSVIPTTPLARHVAVGAAITLLFWAAIGLYHRLAPSEQLDHPARRSLYEAIQRAPGLRLVDLSRATGIHPKTARYHVDALATARLVVRDETGGYRVPGAAPATTIEDRVLALVQEAPGIHVSDLARRLGVSKACAQSRVTDLLLAGALESRAESGMRRLFAPAAIAA